MKLDRGNPVPFRQPFLRLRVVADGQQEDWNIDVEGQVHLYFNYKGNKAPYGRLITLSGTLTSQGIIVIAHGSYAGQEPATHIMRNGLLFERMIKIEKSNGAETANLFPSIHLGRWDDPLTLLDYRGVPYSVANHA